MLRTLLAWTTWVAAALLGGPALLVLTPGLAGADEAQVVRSGSMEPAVRTGDLVGLSAPGADEPIGVGDVIAYRTGARGGPVVLHRVVAVLGEAEQTYYVTKGDANQDPDPDPVPRGRVVGLYRFRVPAYGYLVEFAHTKAGILALVVLPSLAVMGREAVVFARSSRRPPAWDATRTVVEGAWGVASWIVESSWAVLGDAAEADREPAPANLFPAWLFDPAPGAPSVEAWIVVAHADAEAPP